MSIKANSLLLVIPPVVWRASGELLVDGDFANNLSAYLRSFDRVTVMCPLSTTASTFPSMVRVETIAGQDRLQIIILPFAYREDRYLANRWTAGRLIRKMLRQAEYILLTPHAGFDWSTLAAKICISENIPYNLEADANLPEMRLYSVSRMSPGVRKLRAIALARYHNRQYLQAVRNSHLALLQGGDVYNDLTQIAPHAFSVLNVQITNKEHITKARLRQKIDNIREGVPLSIFYAGRAIDIKGPEMWLDVITRLRDWGCTFNATWAGEGERLDEMRQTVAARGLAEICSLPGKLDREMVRHLAERAHLFMFCHMVKESPRCLVEALGSGTPIVGFGSGYSRGLVAESGGGAFVEPGDVEGLANEVRRLFEEPKDLRRLVEAAAASGRQLDRDRAIEHRIKLMRIYLKRKADM